MSQLNINIGQAANDKTGDTIRVAFSKVNANFTELYATTGADVQLPSQTGNANKYLKTDGTTLSWGTVTQGASDRLVNGSLEAILDASGTINTPLFFPKTFTALLLPVYGGGTDGPYGGNAWEISVTFSADADGIVTTSVDNIFPITNNPGYKNGDSWTFHEADHGIPGYTFTLTLGNVVYPGGAGWTANVSTSEPPEYTPTVKSLGAIKLTSNGHSIVLGTDGYLTTESIHVQGSLKGVDGSTGSTGQVLTRQSNGGVAWADSTGGVSTSTRWDATPTEPGNNCPIYAELTPDHFQTFTQQSNLGIRNDGSWNIGSNYNGTGLYGLGNTATLYSNYGNVAIRVNDSQSYFTFGNNGTLTLPDGSTIGEGEWYSNNGVTLQNHDSDFSLQSGVSASANGRAAIHSQNDSGSIQLSVTTDSHNNIVTISNNSNNWTFGTDGGLTLPLGGYITAPSAMGSNTVIQAPVSNRALLQNSDGTNLVAADDQGVAMTTARGTVQFGYNLEAPGVPTHFHINKLNQSFDLFFGDDSNYFHLPAGGGSPVIGANDTNSGQKLWTFGQDGSLTLPQSNSGAAVISAGAVGLEFTSNGHALQLGTDGTLIVPGDIKSVADTGDVVIHANNGTQRTWTFGGDGSTTFPDSTRQTTAYAGSQIRQTTVTLTPADLAGLNSYPGKTLVSAAGLTSNQVIVVTALEFSLTYNTTPYTTTANLYLNYSGNYLTVAQAIPAGNTTANNNTGMLTSSKNTYRYVQNGMVDGDFPPQQDVILMSDGAISNGNSDLRVRVTYIITGLF
jgi:hypothetical protein